MKNTELNINIHTPIIVKIDENKCKHDIMIPLCPKCFPKTKTMEAVMSMKKEELKQ